MAVKEKPVPLKFEDLKVYKTYRGKNPKMIGIFGPLVNDRQILYISEFRKVVDYIDHGYSPEFEEWCKQKTWPCRSISSNIDQLEYEQETGKEHRNIEAVWDYVVQYNSPSVKFGKKYPTIPASKFLKWAAKNVTDILPENGDWASSL